MKNCATCHQPKNLAEFDRRGGSRIDYQASCKVCERTREHQRRAEHPERYLAKGQRYYAKHQAEIAARRSAAYAAHPERWRARRQVSKALVSGALTKEPCQVCGAIKTEGHHPDYSKALEVIWLCRHHHRLLHP